MHIQKEVLAGVFNIPFSKYETFEQGLIRYRMQVLCNTEEEKQQIRITQAVNKIKSEDVDPYRSHKFDYNSDYDKYEKSEQLGIPIREKEDMRVADVDFINDL